VTMTGIDMIRLSEGKMVEDRVEVDQLGMMQQLGAVKSPSGMQRMPTGPAEGTRAPCGETTTVPCVRSHPK
jgi:hypothetical protein